MPQLDFLSRLFKSTPGSTDGLTRRVLGHTSSQDGPSVKKALQNNACFANILHPTGPATHEPS